MPVRPENLALYPSNWLVVTHWVKFVRAGGRCECWGECGRDTHVGRCPNEHELPAYGTGSRVILTTAHLNHDPSCWDMNVRGASVLRAMCQGCHLHYDREHHAQTRARTRAAEVARLMDPLF